MSPLDISYVDWQISFAFKLTSGMRKVTTPKSSARIAE
jgi:hypothetical protein